MTWYTSGPRLPMTEFNIGDWVETTPRAGRLGMPHRHGEVVMRGNNPGELLVRSVSGHEWWLTADSLQPESQFLREQRTYTGGT